MWWLGIITDQIGAVDQQVEVAVQQPMLIINVAGVKIQASIPQQPTRALRKQQAEAAHQAAIVFFQTGIRATIATPVGVRVLLVVAIHAVVVDFLEEAVAVRARVVAHQAGAVVEVAHLVEPGAGINQ